MIIDPLPLSSHDKDHLERLGQTSWIVITNSDHIRDAKAVAEEAGAKILGPRAERSRFPLDCDQWIMKETVREILGTDPTAVIFTMNGQDGAEDNNEVARMLEAKRGFEKPVNIKQVLDEIADATK